MPPAELEALLLTHPQVADAAVIGLPDDEAGEIPAAYVVLEAGAGGHGRRHPSASSPSKVASYKQIRKVTFVDAIPKSASGKILRRGAARASRSLTGRLGGPWQPQRDSNPCRHLERVVS